MAMGLITSLSATHTRTETPKPNRDINPKAAGWLYQAMLRERLTVAHTVRMWWCQQVKAKAAVGLEFGGDGSRRRASVRWWRCQAQKVYLAPEPI